MKHERAVLEIMKFEKTCYDNPDSCYVCEHSFECRDGEMHCNVKSLKFKRIEECRGESSMVEEYMRAVQTTSSCDSYTSAI